MTTATVNSFKINNKCLEAFMDTLFTKQLFSTTKINIGKAFIEEFKITDPELAEAEEMEAALAIIGSKYLVD